MGTELGFTAGTVPPVAASGAWVRLACSGMMVYVKSTMPFDREDAMTDAIRMDRISRTLHVAGARLAAAALAVLVVVGGVTGCSYTQLAEAGDGYYEDYGAEPDVSYLPDPVRGSFGQLSMWGFWIEVPGFGWVWKPDVSAYDWQPYTEGYWNWTGDDWRWASYEPFGWIVYHYGYWNFDPQYGWYWIPDYYWVPNTVTWMYFDDFVCWAPIPPPGCHLLDPWEMHASDVWVVVRARHFLNRGIRDYRYRGVGADPRSTSSRIFRSSPRPGYIEKRTGTRVGIKSSPPRRINVPPTVTPNPPPNRDGKNPVTKEKKPTKKPENPVTKEKNPTKNRDTRQPVKKTKKKSGKGD